MGATMQCGLGLTRRLLSAVVLLSVIFNGVNGAEAGGLADNVDVSCGGYAPNSILQSLQDIPAAARDVVSAAVPLYNSNQHSTAACVYESLLWKLLQASWLDPNDPTALLAARTLNVSQILATRQWSVWPVKRGSDFVGSVVLGGGVTAGNGSVVTAGSSGPTASSNGTGGATASLQNSTDPAQAPNAGYTPSADVSTQIAPISSDGSGQQRDVGSTSGTSTNWAEMDTADQTRSWVGRWALEALAGWGDVVGACNAMADTAHSQQVLQIAGFLQGSYPEQCGLSLLIGTEQIRVVCGAALVALNNPPDTEPPADLIAGGGTSNPPSSPSAKPSPDTGTTLQANYNRIATLVSRLSGAIGQTVLQSPGERRYVLVSVIASAPSSTGTASTGASSPTAQLRTPPAFWTSDGSANNNCSKIGCTGSSVSTMEALLFSLGGLMGLFILGVCMLILIRARRNRLSRNTNRVAITPPPAPASEPPQQELKSPLAIALRAFAVWLPNGLAAIAYEDRTQEKDIETGEKDSLTPRTPKALARRE